MPDQPKRDAADADRDDEDTEDEPAELAPKRPKASSEDDEEAPRPPKKSTSSKPVKRAASAKPVKPASRRRPGPQLPPEDEIDAPKKQTLWMLGALAFAIVAMWGASRLACNAHPMQTRKPRDIGTAELAKDPKGAALELAQRWASYDFAGALELAGGSVAADLQKAKQECDADKSACDKKRDELKDKVLATAILLSREGERAKARVSTDGGATGKETYVLELAREGAIWKGVAKGPDTGAPQPAPVPTPAASP